MGSYGLDQCLDLVETSLRNADARADAGWVLAGWVGHGPGDDPHHSAAWSFRSGADRALGEGRYELTVGTAEFGNGTTTVHAQIAASVLNTTPASIRIRQSDTA